MKYQIACLAVLACALVLAEANKIKICKPGQIFKKDCNICICDQVGFDMSCTKVNCHQPFPTYTYKPQPLKRGFLENCIPGNSFKLNCNVCICPPSGIKSQAVCTLVMCPGIPLTP